jgi:hypothetical protein
VMKSDEILIKTFDQVKNDNFDQVKFDQVIVCRNSKKKSCQKILVCFKTFTISRKINQIMCFCDIPSSLHSLFSCSDNL